MPTTAPAPATAADDDDKRVEPLELFFDLVFVFALTQVTARLAYDLSWAGLGRGLLVLAAIWWAWAAYSWLTNEVDCRRRLVSSPRGRWHPQKRRPAVPSVSPCSPAPGT